MYNICRVDNKTIYCVCIVPNEAITPLVGNYFYLPLNLHMKNNIY